MTPNQAALNFFRTRKSVPLTQFKGPGPDDAQITELLEIAARVPDHGRVEPWRFIIYRGEAALKAGVDIAALAVKQRGEIPEQSWTKRSVKCQERFWFERTPIRHKNHPFSENYTRRG